MIPHWVFAVTFCTFVFLPTSAQTPTISFLPPSATDTVPSPSAPPNPLLSNLTFPSNLTRFDQFKNSPFTSLCPFQLSAPLASSAKTIRITDNRTVSWAQAKSQEQFCQYLRPDIEWVVLPTTPTDAAFLPDWPEILRLAGSELFTFITVILGRTKAPSLGVVLLIQQFFKQILWLYHIIVALRDPIHAPWMDPLASLDFAAITATAADIFDDDDYGETNSGCVMNVTYIWALIHLIISFVYAGLRFPSVRLGSGSYDPFLAAPFTTNPHLTLNSAANQGCNGLLQSIRYPLLSDPLSRQIRIIYMIFISLSVPVVLLSRSFTRKDGYAYVAALVGFILHIMGTIWTGVLAGRGTPFIWDEQCGLVVVAMSPKLGYWDAKVLKFANRPKSGYILQILRAIFGLSFAAKNPHQTSTPAAHPDGHQRIAAKLSRATPFLLARNPSWSPRGAHTSPPCSLFSITVAWPESRRARGRCFLVRRGDDLSWGVKVALIEDELTIG
ncbi:hypothetical protein GALMADRAFT_141172 [Galerina marginata CBS 339.88]|uniref:Wax synthase domain-containing protein n=1 Tax=Galerina marginata (strain CBS 339.88) TaxID=685588 RepID=A0A067T4I7_GALM3|nr:hypothetical protein GALMADRAFT_141172 [Galerina marginata CBS 339.88]